MSARPRNKSKFKLIDWKDRACWYVEFYSDQEQKIVRRSTGRKKSEYSREQMRRIIDSETGAKHIEEHSIDWLEEYTIHSLEMDGRAEKTIEGYKQAFIPLREVYGGGYSVMHIDRRATNEIKDRLHKKGNRPSTINTILRRLRSAFERIYIEETIDRNPFYRFPKVPERDKKQKSLSRAEMQRLLDVLQEHPNKNLVHLMRISIYTAIRRGELLNVEKEDINLSERFFRALNNKSRDKHKVMRVMPKPVVNDFRYFLELHPNWDYPLRVYRPNSYTCTVKKLLKQYEFPADLHLHSLRHTAITLALEGGQPLREIQKIVDHSAHSTTEGYGHDSVLKELDLGLEE